MSLRLRSIALDGFRKFREPVMIDGLADGLNIIIEANETGKSTLLEALRAAFFVRHNTKNQLAQSYAPHGDAVGPLIRVDFDVDGAAWSVSKRFLRGASVEVTGPKGRAQGEEAEARLNTLLGSIRDSSRMGDVSTYGALGLLWVAQTEALEVVAPGQIVRDSVAATLEAEVGSIMGGPAYKRVRGRVEDQYGLYWTPTGQKKGRQNEVRERVEVAETAARSAAERLAALEKTFADLEAARARLKVIERDLADETDAQRRGELAASLDIARAAAQILATRRAEQEAAQAQVRGLEDLQRRHEAATAAGRTAEVALITARSKRQALAETLQVARQRVADARLALETARTARQGARVALDAGEARVRAQRRATAVASAQARHDQLRELERARCNAKALSDTLIAAKFLTGLEEHDRAVAEAHATMNAGATRLAFTGPSAGITLDDQPIVAGDQVLTKPTTIRIGDAELIITPPAAVDSAQEALTSALRKRSAALEELGVASLAAARERNDTARDAAANLRTLDAQIQAVTPADPAVDLAAGSAALKLFVRELGEEPAPIEPGEVPNVAALTDAVKKADAELARTEGVHDSAISALRRVEDEDAPLATTEAGAISDQSNAVAQIEAIEGRQEFATLSQDLTGARERAASAAVRLDDATRDATAHDQASIARKIEMIDARTRTAIETRNKVVTDIARLENTVEIEGGAGLASRAAAADEEAEAARSAQQRVSEEADTLKLLRETLDKARDETSAKFVGPVARRAKRYIGQLLPGCELTFSEELALIGVTRAGVPESCAHLSRGTQEQLAVLTRIAFADMLLEQGRPVSLILDDPLVYSDDARLDLMIDILNEAATRMQVILLTCRDRAFRHVSGNRILMAS